MPNYTGACQRIAKFVRERLETELEMNWDALGAIGELLGAVGVLITLVYLSIQVRNNSAQTHNATIESVMTADAESRAALVNGPVPRIYDAVSKGEAISGEDKQILVYYLQAYMQGWEVAFYLNERGSLPDDVLNAIAFRRLATLYTLDKVVSWSSYKAGYTPAFQDHVQTRLADFNSKPKPWENEGQSQDPLKYEGTREV